MAVRCERCGRAFQNKYAVWGHLRVCRPGSVEAELAQPASSAYGLAQPGLEPRFSHELPDEEELQLRRRRLELERRELEREENAAWRLDLETLNTLAETARRRGVVEQVCSPFAELAYTLKGYQVPPGTRDVAKRRVQEEFERAGGERSREELVKIAEQAREQVYAPVFKAQEDARAETARAAAEREALLAREQEEARRREQVMINTLTQGIENHAPATQRPIEERKLTNDTDGDHEREDDAENELDFEDEPARSKTDDDEPDGDTEPEDELEDEEEPVSAGWKTFLTLGAIALGVAMLSARNSSKVWIADPDSGGDGSFEVGSAPPGPKPPWREASQMEIQRGLQSGALEPA